MADVVGLIAEVFTWVGVLGAIGLAFLALVFRIADGSWAPARAVVEHTDEGALVRWFDDQGTVNEAPLTAHDLERIGGRDMADIYYRIGWHNRMRLSPGSPAVRAFVRLTLLLVGVAVLAYVAGWIALIVEA
ncbi:hypothetical protein [Microbacterium sp. CJ77]|uniref:hypothetical protein n=1 Tax=Microbacterium sp. CJ77 TaxID=2079201 RepID=UPI000CD922B4|nr:hypothetical protein [Microbacterium sp. CJ77]